MKNEKSKETWENIKKHGKKMLANFEAWNGWEIMPSGITIDSGAAETVCPEATGKHYKLKPSISSEAGLEYQSATGEAIPNLGEKGIEFNVE